MDELDLTGSEINIPIQPFSTEPRSEMVEGLRVKMEVSSIDDIFTMELNDVTAVKGLPFKFKLVPGRDDWFVDWNGQ